MINKKSTIDYSEHPLTKNFLNNIMSQGGEAAGVYTLKNDEKRVVRVVHALNAEMAEGGIYDLLVDIGKNEHWPSRALKTESIEVVHGNFSEDLKAAQLQVQQRGYGSHDLADFKLASKEQVGQLIKDVSVLDRLGINFDAKPRNILFDKEIGFQLLDLIPKTLYANAQEAMERNSTKDANHIKRILRITQSLLGNTFSNKELQEVVKSINSNKPIIGSSTSVASIVQPTMTATAAPVVPPVTSVPAATIAPINPIAATATPAPAPTQTQVPVNSTRPLKDRILSFDIETSSLDPGNGFIWQTGFASYDNNGNLTSSGEYFAPSDNASVSDLQDRLTTSEFGKKQHEAGRFNEYLASQKRQQGDVTKSLLNAMSGDKDVLLIQNSNFERRWMESHAFSGTAEAGDVAALSDKSAYSYFKRGTQTKVGSLYPSPEILGLRNEASAKYYKFLQTGDAALFDEAAKLHSDIMARYATELLDTTSGKYKVVDLMDITKSVFAKAAEEGLIDKRHVTIGTSQEFLARMFNLGEETHLAPGDSKQAMSIFVDNLMPLYKDLTSGNISDNTKRIFKQISDAQPTEATHQYMRSLTRAFDEAQSQAGYRQSIPIGNSKIEKLEFIDNRTGSIVKSSREFQTGRRYLKAEDSAAIIEDVSSRYRNIPTAGFSAEQVEQEVERLPTPIQKREFVETLSREVRENKDKLPNLRDADINAGSLKKWFKNNRGKSIALGLAALGAIAITDSDNGSAEEIKTTKAAKRQMSQSIDNSLRIYSKPRISIDPDHGSGFADWNERTRHHEYF